jgi:methionine transaminase
LSVSNPIKVKVKNFNPTTPTFQSKLPNIGTTIFTIMSNLANEHGALNLSQGFPSFDCHPELQELVFENIKNGKNQYASMLGVLELREALSEKYNKLWAINYDPQAEITITAGATQALYCAFAAFISAGDEVIVIEPCYDLYVPTITMHGGIPVYCTLTPTNNYQINWTDFEKLVTTKTRAIVINTPQNPNGSILQKEDLDQLSRIVRDKNIIIISDEAYEHIVYDGLEHWSLMRHPELKQKTLICGSFGKTYHTTGWKIGFCLANPSLTAEFRKIHQWINFSINTPIQYAYAEFLKIESQYLALSAFYQQKKDLFLDTVKNSRFEILPAQGTFFQSLSYKNITDEADFDYAIRLIKEIGVASIPLSVFYNQKNDYRILRFCVAKNDEMLIEAGKRLSNL